MSSFKTQTYIYNVVLKLVLVGISYMLYVVTDYEIVQTLFLVL